MILLCAGISIAASAGASRDLDYQYPSFNLVNRYVKYHYSCLQRQPGAPAWVGEEGPTSLVAPSYTSGSQIEFLGTDQHISSAHLFRGAPIAGRSMEVFWGP